MYKKVLLFAIAIMSFSSSIFAQCASCTPITGTALQVAPYYVGGKYINGFYPNPAPTGCVGQPYEETIQVVLPLDTITSPFPITLTFTSWKIISISNTPPGLQFTTVPGLNTSFTPPSGGTVPATACAVICGTPTQANTVSDSAVIVVEAVTSLQTGQLPVKFRVPVSNCAAGADRPEGELKINVYPNPVNESTIFSYELIENSKVEIKLMDMTGRVIKSTSMQQGAGLQTVNIFEGLNVNSGIYLLNAKINEKVYTVRVIMN